MRSIDPMSILPLDIHHLILPSLTPSQFLSLRQVSSIWDAVIKKMFPKRFLLDYIPSGASPETYEDYCVLSSKELKERVQKFLREVGYQKAVFICSFPFSQSISFLVIKWNPLGRVEDFFHDCIKDWNSEVPQHKRFMEDDYDRILPYLLSRRELTERNKTLHYDPHYPIYLDVKDFEDCTAMYGGSKYLRDKNSKLILKVCFAAKKIPSWGLFHEGFPGCIILLGSGVSSVTDMSTYVRSDECLVKEIKKVAILETGIAHGTQLLYLVILSLAMQIFFI